MKVVGSWLIVQNLKERKKKKYIYKCKWGRREGIKE
jgi:hypothetical protein